MSRYETLGPLDLIQRPKQQAIGLLSLFIYTFSAVGSGPAGIEGIIGNSSPLFAILGILLFPFFWSYAQALISAELSLRYKDSNGGAAAWALKLFGRKACFLIGTFIILIQCSTAAFVNEVSVSYIQTVSPGFNTYGKQLMLCILLILASVAVNVVSIDFTSKMCMLFTINALVSFGVLVVLSFPKLDIHRLTEDNIGKSYKKIDWPVLVNLLVYNSAGYDASASIIDYVVNPKSNVPRSILLTAFTISILYISSLLFPYLASRDSYQDWQVGHFSLAAKQIGGTWLQMWIVVACILTDAQIYFASLQTASYTLLALADYGVYWKWGSKKTSRGTPHAAMFACALLSLAFAIAPLNVNLTIESVLSSIILIFEAGCLMYIDKKTIFAPRDKLQRFFIIAAPVILATFAISVQPTYTLFAVGAIILLLCVSIMGIDKME